MTAELDCDECGRSVPATRARSPVAGEPLCWVCDIRLQVLAARLAEAGGVAA